MPTKRPLTKLEKELLRLAGFEDDISDDKETAHSGSSSLDDDDVSSSDSGESEDSGDNDSDELSDEDATRPESGSCQCSECLKMMKKERFCSCNLASKDALRQIDSTASHVVYLVNIPDDSLGGKLDANDQTEELLVRNSKDAMTKRKVNKSAYIPPT